MRETAIFRYSYETLENWCHAIFRTANMPPDEIYATTRVLLDTNLRGIDSHGINMVPQYTERYRSIEHRNVAITEDFAAGCIIDGGNHTGQFTTLFALERAIEKAQHFGIGFALVKESSHNGAAGYYASLAAEKGFISLSTTTVMPLLAPWGGLEPFVGNNPFAIGFPYRKMPIVLDVANTVVARQKIFAYAREGKTIPDGWAMDRDGNPTNDPESAIHGLLMPVGGHKGAGLALMIDIILGTLSGGFYARSICANTVPDRPQHISHLLILIDPDYYMRREDLDTYLSQYVSDFKKVHRKADVAELFLPGEPEWNSIKERKAHGIPLSFAVVRELNAYAAKIGEKCLNAEV